MGTSCRRENDKVAVDLLGSSEDLVAMIALYYKPTSELSVPAAALAIISASKIVT